ncbi:MAG TPA: MFS transporter, partial [Bdellovibrionales bacterium]|nr:MFS transporter [Bdellovibrionales bacterium]
MRELLRNRLSPFRHRHFRNFFLAQTLSLVGSWSHDLARAWIVVSATGSSGALGNINTALAVPCLFLILQGGVLVDRADVRKLLMWTKTLLGISGIVLALLTETSEIQIWHLMIFAVIEGVIVSFDSPAFQALTVRLVPRAEFQAAIALNSTNFHSSRMLGPVIAAWLMNIHGPGLVFMFDAVTYFLVAVVLSRVELDVRPAINKERKRLRDGLRYIANHPQIRFRVMQLMLTIAVVFPLTISVFRVFIQTKFNLDAHEFGYVFSLIAIGSMAGALTFAVVQPKEPEKALFYGVPLVIAMLLVMPFMPTLMTPVTAMGLSGYGLYLTFASLTVSM